MFVVMVILLILGGAVTIGCVLCNPYKFPDMPEPPKVDPPPISGNVYAEYAVNKYYDKVWGKGRHKLE